MTDEAVFLRILEYYSGILFLTTNRVGAFDDAFRSRIHLTLYYPKLDARSSLKIWKTNLRRMKNLNQERVQSGRQKVEIDKDDILRYAKNDYKRLQWNGRQIRNAFQTALALAEFEVRGKADKRPRVTVTQFKTIAKASIDFDKYLEATHGMSEDKTAKRDRVRAEYSAKRSGKARDESASEISDSELSSEMSEELSVDELASGSSEAVSEDDKKGKKKRRAGKK